MSDSVRGPGFTYPPHPDLKLHDVSDFVAEVVSQQVCVGCLVAELLQGIAVDHLGDSKDALEVLVATAMTYVTVLGGDKAMNRLYQERVAEATLHLMGLLIEERAQEPRA